MGMPPGIAALLGGGGGAPGGGAPPNPMTSTVMGALANKTANPGEDFAKQAANLQGADPSMILRQLEQVNQLLGVLFVKTFQSLPNVANNISATMKALSRAIKEGQQASNVGEVVGKADQANQPPPISFSPAQGGENSQPSGAAY